MATLKQLRTRLKSMNSTRKITSAMKLVAASKWRRQQEKWHAMQAYSLSLEKEMLSLIAEHTHTPHINKDSILIVCTPHKGLCGGYPAYIKQTVTQALSVKKYDVVVVTTEKGRTLLKGINTKIESMPSHDIATHIHQWHSQGHHVSVVRGFSRNAMKQEAELVELIPYKKPEATLKKDENVVCEPNIASLAAPLVEHALTLRWQSIHLGSVVAEEAARMSAMDQATRNADSAIGVLQRSYNRLRQEKITTELVEMISGSSLA